MSNILTRSIINNMTEKDEDEPCPEYVIYQALIKLKEAQITSMERPYRLKQLINEAVEILEEYSERE